MTGTTATKVKGSTIADVLDIIQSNYSSGGGSGLTISNVELNANGDYGIKSGLITMSDGSAINIEVKLIDSLTLTAAEGSATGKTIISVSEELTTGNHYQYKAGSGIILPAKGDDLSGWTAWNGSDEISAQNGVTVYIAECDADNKAVKCGTCVAVSPIF